MEGYRAQMEAVRRHFAQHLGLAGPTVAHAEQVIEALDLGGFLASAEHRGAVEERDEHKAEACRLRTLMAEAAKLDPVTCRKWIRDALATEGQP